MADTAHQGIYLTVRDPEAIRAAMGGRSYRQVAVAAGVATATLHELARGLLRRTSVPTAVAIETELEKAPGTLFGLAATDAELLSAYTLVPVPVAS